MRRVGPIALMLAGSLAGAMPVAASDFAPGEKLTLIHCGRCHVINDRNKYGGIGSTPSFGALRTLPDWEARIEAFHTLAPHPAFTQIDGVTEPFPEDRPSPIHPVVLTLEEVGIIRDFTRTIAPKDLGAPVR